MNYRALFLLIVLVNPYSHCSFMSPKKETFLPSSSAIISTCINASLFSAIFVLVAMLVNKVPNLFKKNSDPIYRSAKQNADKQLCWAGPIPEELERLFEAQKNGALFKKFNIEPPRGYLFYGPPGNGKTLLAEYIAQTLDVPLFKETSGSFLNIYQGSGTNHLNELLEKAHALPSNPNKPFKAIIFIDEIDGIVCREKTLNREELRLAEHLLAAITDQKNEGILFLGATNIFDSIDKALIRSGRLIPVAIPLPSGGWRKALFDHYLEKHNLVLESTSSIALAEETVGFSCSDIKNVIQEALYLKLKKPSLDDESCVLQTIQTHKRSLPCALS